MNEPKTKTLSHAGEERGEESCHRAVSQRHVNALEWKSEIIVQGMKPAHAMSATIVPLRRGENRE